MAVRFKSPIYTFDFIMEQAGVVLEDTGEEIKGNIITDEKNPDSFDQYSLKALKQMLDNVLETEDYERAAKIRDEINKRESESE